MKKSTFSLLPFFYFIIICNCLQAQKIYKASLQNAGYTGRLTSMESQLSQLVYRDFATRKEIIVLDFTSALTADAITYKSSLQKFLKSENIFSITNATGFVNLIKEKPEAITLVIPYKNKSLLVDLITSDIFTDGFRVCTDKNPGGTLLQTSAFYKGVVRGTNAFAGISLFADHIEGFITLNEKTSVEITKISGTNPTNQHVVYDDADLLIKSKGHYCTLLNPPAAQMEKPQHTPNENTTTSAYTCVTNYWETAYSVYQHFGSEKKVSDFVTSLFNVYATIYTNEKISMKLKTSFVWTSADPYNDDLTTFSNTRTGYGANTAVLLSNAAKGGVAWLNTICQSSDTYRHAYCGSIASFEQVLPITSYSWPVEVTSHEVGHNLGSPHTHACAWNGNNTAIDGCGPAAGYSEGCSGPIPSGGGTIMSYCHLISAGINLTKGFGKQPGDLIRSKVNSCITTTCTAIGTNCNAPTNVVANNITGSTANIKWKNVKGAAYYYIYLSADGGSTYTLIADHLYNTSFNASGLLINHNYICDVWVSCGNGNYNSTRINFTTGSAIATAASGKLQKTAFTIQPNPVHGSHFTVTLEKGYENAVVEIFNGNKDIMYESHTGVSIRSFTAPQTKGLYYVRVTLGDEIISRKFLVE